MKIGITGHTAGIGKALYESLSHSHTVIGFSRSNGYNLSDVKKIVNDASDCDVLINNAHGLGEQAQLAEAWRDANKTANKLIINMSSEIVKYSDTIKDKSEALNHYLNAKQSLGLVSHSINRSTTCRSTMLLLGWVDTMFVDPATMSDSVLLKSYNYHKVNNTMITPQEVVDVVMFLISQNSCISELLVTNKILKE